MEEKRFNKSVELTDEAVKDVTGGLNCVADEPSYPKREKPEDADVFYPCPECGALSPVPHKCANCGWVDPRTTTGGFA